MGKAVKIPDPVFERVQEIADRDDVPMGIVIRDWMQEVEHE